MWARSAGGPTGNRTQNPRIKSTWKTEVWLGNLRTRNPSRASGLARTFPSKNRCRCPRTFASAAQPREQQPDQPIEVHTSGTQPCHAHDRGLAAPKPANATARVRLRPELGSWRAGDSVRDALRRFVAERDRRSPHPREPRQERRHQSRRTSGVVFSGVQSNLRGQPATADIGVPSWRPTTSAGSLHAVPYLV